MIHTLPKTGIAPEEMPQQLYLAKLFPSGLGLRVNQPESMSSLKVASQGGPCAFLSEVFSGEAGLGPRRTAYKYGNRIDYRRLPPVSFKQLREEHPQIVPDLGYNAPGLPILSSGLVHTVAGYYSVHHA